MLGVRRPPQEFCLYKEPRPNKDMNPKAGAPPTFRLPNPQDLLKKQKKILQIYFALPVMPLRYVFQKHTKKIRNSLKKLVVSHTPFLSPNRPICSQLHGSECCRFATQDGDREEALPHGSGGELLGAPQLGCFEHGFWCV